MMSPGLFECFPENDPVRRSKFVDREVIITITPTFLFNLRRGIWANLIVDVTHLGVPQAI